MNRVVVVRSPWRSWLLALLGLPFLVLGVQLVVEGDLLRMIGGIVYGGPERMPGAEWRDQVWGWGFTLGGGALAGWGVLQLVRPTRLVLADRERICLDLRGPFRPPVCLGWDEVMDLRLDRVRDGEEELPALTLVVKDPSVLPDRLWGGRRGDRWTLAVLAGDWNPPAEEAIPRMEELRSLGS